MVTVAARRSSSGSPARTRLREGINAELQCLLERYAQVRASLAQSQHSAEIAGKIRDPFDVSDADTMLKYIAPDAEPPKNVTIFTRRGCPFCVKAKKLLKNAGMEYDELVLNEDFRESTIRAISGHTTVPQVFIDGVRIGGADDLEKFLDVKAGIAA